ncbi:hypothetical protein ACFQ3S_02970 [Mucilaginibacter terrae]|uniref:hypothetical protein n=1 Tax=Mucilaginibacter terrae TaxID=1955052 RepID=UPI00363E5272
MVENTFKYRIDEFLNQLPVLQYRHAMRLIPELLDVSPRTFANYRNIKLNDSRDIPHEKVALLEKLFALHPGELQNFVIVASPITELTDTDLYLAQKL